MKKLFSFTGIFLVLLFCLVNPSTGYSSSPRSKGPFLIYTHSSGLFATFASILGALDYYEKGNYAGFKVDIFEGAYLDPEQGPNWWDYYFEPIVLGNENYPKKHVFTVAEHCRFVGDAFAMPKYKAARLIRKYVHIKPEVQQKIDQFYNDNLAGHFVIGIHYRGTDKVSESPIVPYEKMCKPVLKVYSKLSNKEKETFIVYVATDDQRFLDYIATALPFPIVYNNFVRTTDDTAVHWGNDDKFQNNYQKGEEAVIDCLLLSKCDALVKTESCLSAISELFNLGIPVFVVHATD